MAKIKFQKVANRSINVVEGKNEFANNIIPGDMFFRQDGGREFAMFLVRDMKGCNSMFAVQGDDVFECWVFQNNTGKIQVVFNDGTVEGLDVNIEDGDVMFTERAEAEQYIAGKKQSGESSVEDKASAVVSVFGELIKELAELNGKQLAEQKLEQERAEYKLNRRDKIVRELDSARAEIKKCDAEIAELQQRIEHLKDQRTELRDRANDLLDKLVELDCE